jgi:quercetin dioxygenase-like cupin family protein
MSHPANLPLSNSYITDHTEDGASIFSTELGDTPHYKPLPPSTVIMADLHHSPQIPVPLSPEAENNDLKATSTLISTNTHAARVFPEPSTVFRRIDHPPGAVSPMHRTISVDYGIVLSGEVELSLESGEKRILRAGDTVVQRATMHQWRNLSETEWCRMVFVMMPATELVVAGKTLTEEFRFT